MTARRTWQGIEADEPPCRRHDHAELLAMAESMLAARERRFPAMIEAGQIERATAEAELATIAAIVADWRWICSGEGQPAPEGTLLARIEVLDASLATIAAIAREQEGFSSQLAEQAECVIAMRWHLEPGRQTHALAAVNRQLRARAAVCPTCERRRDDPATRACVRTDCGLPARHKTHGRKAA